MFLYTYITCVCLGDNSRVYLTPPAHLPRFFPRTKHHLFTTLHLTIAILITSINTSSTVPLSSFSPYLAPPHLAPPPHTSLDHQGSKNSTSLNSSATVPLLSHILALLIERIPFMALGDEVRSVYVCVFVCVCGCVCVFTLYIYIVIF